MIKRFVLNDFVQKYFIRNLRKLAKCCFKGELWVKLNFQAQLRHDVSYLRSNCE